MKRLAVAIVLLSAAYAFAQASFTYSATAAEQATVARVRADRNLPTDAAAFNALVGPCIASIVSDHVAADRASECAAWRGRTVGQRTAACAQIGLPATCQLGCAP